MTTRDDIFRSVRKALKRDKPSAETLQMLERRLLNAETQVVPARGQIPHEHQIRLFMDMAREASTSIVEVPGLREVPHAVAEYLVGHNLPAEIVMAPSPVLDRLPWLEKIPWSERPLIEIRRGRAEPRDLVSLTGAFAGIAETGTLMLLSGPESPTTLNLMPDHHLVVLSAAQVLGTYEEAWSKLRERARALSSDVGRVQLPRTVNFITGPSRSGDIEQTLQMGAHGPRRVHVILVHERFAETG
jgi:L-lactate dehydrogenase complex protein LldG